MYIFVVMLLTSSISFHYDINKSTQVIKLCLVVAIHQIFVFQDIWSSVIVRLGELLTLAKKIWTD